MGGEVAKRVGKEEMLERAVGIHEAVLGIGDLVQGADQAGRAPTMANP